MLLSVQDVSKKFGSRQILSAVNLSVAEGSIVCLTGGNGSGKTTLLDIICGFIRCNTGAVKFQSVDITSLSPWRIARTGITRTFQQTGVFDNLTPLENLVISLPLKAAGSLTGVLRHPLSAYLEINEANLKARSIKNAWLTHLPEVHAVNLSFGQKRMLELVRSLCLEPKLFIFDEPLSALSSEHRTKVLELIKTIRDKGKSVLFVEHDHEAIAALADYVYFLEAGAVIFHGSCSDFFSELPNINGRIPTNLTV